jgi:hypothetical protein
MASRRRQIEELRGLLSRPPSRGLFRSLLRLVQRWGGDLDDAPLEYAHSIVSRWPDTVHRATPPRWFELALRGRAPRAAILCAHLDASSKPLTTHLAATLAAQPSLWGLSSLKLRGDESALRAFFARAELRALRRLEFDGALTDATLRDLCASPLSRGLRHLSVGAGGLSAAAARALATSHAAPTLDTLSLSSNPIGDDGLTALLEDDPLPTLERLHVADCGLTLDAVHVLSLAPARGRLTHLAMDSNALGPGFLPALIDGDASTQLPLTTLSLAGVELGDDGMLALAAASRSQPTSTREPWRALRALEDLNVAHNGITDDGVARMGSPRIFPALRRLDMRWNLLTDWGVDQFARRSSWAALERGEFVGNDIRYERLHHLAFKRP